MRSGPTWFAARRPAPPVSGRHPAPPGRSRCKDLCYLCDRSFGGTRAPRGCGCRRRPVDPVPPSARRSSLHGAGAPRPDADRRPRRASDEAERPFRTPARAPIGCCRGGWRKTIRSATLRRGNAPARAARWPAGDRNSSSHRHGASSARCRSSRSGSPAWSSRRRRSPG